MVRAKEGGWFLRRTYSHFDYPLTFDSAAKLVADKQQIAKRQFLPLVGFSDKKRRFRTDNSNRSIPRRLRPTLASEKVRDIRYAAHGDAAIYQYYAHQIDRPYEDFLRASGLDSCVIGYRQGKGSNVDMAAEVFSEVVSRGNVTALCFDIENFFPTITHKSLRTGLQTVLGKTSLPADWYQVYRSLTKFAWIDIKELSIAEGFDLKDPPFPLVKDINAALNRCRMAKILKHNRDPFGIPQGTPLSAVAANLAMIEFDIQINKMVKERRGFYRRYSDDILILMPPQHEAATLALVTTLAGQFGLTISSAKTDISRFQRQGTTLQADRPLSYLGFCFDGMSTTLRPSTLSRYYRRMTYATRGAVRGAGAKGKSAADTFRRSLFRDFTHLGRRNFYSYSKKADAKMPNSKIKKQLRRHFQILLRKLMNKGK